MHAQTAGQGLQATFLALRDEARGAKRRRELLQRYGATLAASDQAIKAVYLARWREVLFAADVEARCSPARLIPVTP